MSAKCVYKANRFKKLLIIFFASGGFIWLVFAILYPPLPSPKNPLIFYSNQLRNDLKQVVIQAILKAKQSITLQIYGLTDPDVIGAIEKKVAEGIEVTIFYDEKASEKLPFAIPVKSYGLMHRKILVIDGKQAFIGSANFTTQSLKMHDNIIVGIWSESIDSSLEKILYLLPDFEDAALQKLCHQIDHAQNSIQVAMFTLTHKKLIEALERALSRDVKVSIALDRYTANGASKKGAEQLKNAGAILLVSQGNQLLHHKWAFIDEKKFVMGSANWTHSAFSKNQDCLLIFENLDHKEKKTLKKLWRSIAFGCAKG